VNFRLGLIGYGAIGKHIEAAGLEDIDLVAVLVKRPRNDKKLTHDPDGVIGAHELGAFAAGSPERLVELAHELWEGRHDQAAVAERSRRYVAEQHSAEAAGAGWLAVIRRR